MELKAWFEAEIAPCVKADGGWLEVSSESGNTAELTVRGECAHCAALERCVRWAEARAKRELGREIRFTVTRVPFLWRK